MERKDFDFLRRLVAFLVLMESGQGILTKSPRYIKEKFRATMEVPFPEELLDVENKVKFGRYFERWYRDEYAMNLSDATIAHSKLGSVLSRVRQLFGCRLKSKTR